MCKSPILIDNPYLGLQLVGLNRFHDTHSLKIPVPCGNCSSCIALRQSYYIQRCQMESFSHHLFMMTLSYRESMIRFKIVNGRKLYYADFTDVQKMFKRLRNRGLKFSYLVCSEYGGKHHRPHFHAIISVSKEENQTYHDILNLESKLSDMFLGEWRRNYGSDKKPIYKNLCQLVVNRFGRTYDFHYINPISSKNGEDDVAFYVTKYVTKSDSWVDRLKSALKLNLPNEEFSELWKLFKPRACVSKTFGSYNDSKVIAHIRKGIDLSLNSDSKFPYFVHPWSGQTFPLSPLFQKRFLTMSDKEIFFSRSEFSDGYCESEYYDNNSISVADKKLANIRKQINSRLNSYDYSYDFEQTQNLCPEALESNSVDCVRLVDCFESSGMDFDT